MTRKGLCLIATLLVCCCPARAVDETRLLVHLPRTVRVPSGGLTLGSIAALRSKDAERARLASAVAMGRAPFSGERITIDRRTILSRLAVAGIKSKQVALTGADKVVVERDETVVRSQRLLSVAEAFLEKARPGPAGCAWRLVAKPKDLPVTGGSEFSLKARLAKDAPKGFVKVTVVAMDGKRELASSVLAFKLIYPVRQVVATKDIPAGGAVTEANTKVKVVMVEQAPKGEWEPPYGMVASRAIPAGSVIRPALLRAKRTEIVVRRNQAVTMRIEGIGFVVTALGRALQQGRVGDVIKVRNVDSRRIINATVLSDGTVQPIYETR